jgi:hypothetical protein
MGTLELASASLYGSFVEMRKVARHAGLELGGISQGLDSLQPTGQWVPSRTHQVHQIFFSPKWGGVES